MSCAGRAPRVSTTPITTARVMGGHTPHVVSRSLRHASTPANTWASWRGELAGRTDRARGGWERRRDAHAWCCCPTAPLICGSFFGLRRARLLSACNATHTYVVCVCVCAACVLQHARTTFEQNSPLCAHVSHCVYVAARAVCVWVCVCGCVGVCVWVCVCGCPRIAVMCNLLCA